MKYKLNKGRFLAFLLFLFLLIVFVASFVRMLDPDFSPPPQLRFIQFPSCQSAPSPRK